ncbi:hypothetical protein BOX15_Mlig024910g1 [Macrostomum lignano]|uniref:Hexosyltransferase n=1 Tax=Macrostomum lignano TaxID=282301 RepID=A0A267F8S4_9PLAT|nr:hypothetical protein BOX15_Mlig024910g1 [Macrostomum lignano]
MPRYQISTRLISRWLWTLLVLASCTTCLLLLVAHSSSSSESEKLLQNKPPIFLLSPLRSLQQQHDQKLNGEWFPDQVSRIPSTQPLASRGLSLDSSAGSHVRRQQQQNHRARTEAVKKAPMLEPTRQPTAEAEAPTPVAKLHPADSDNARPTRQSRAPSGQPTAATSFRDLCWQRGFSPASGKPINHTPDDFIISESRLCSGRPLLLALVHSEFGYRERRDLIRSTWASVNNINGHRIVVAFVVGATRTAEQQAKLQEESQDAADLVQVPCSPDGQPSASTCKALYGLRWASQNCAGARFLLKVDDYAFVNVFQLVTLVTERLADANQTFYCRTAPDENRITQSGYYWYVSEEEWPEDKYPLHCKGLAYLMSGDLPSQLVQCAAWRNLLHLEDIFVTGVLGKALQANFMHWLRGWDSDWLHPKHAGPAVVSALVLATPEGAPLPNLQRRVWRAALRHSAGLAGLD